MVQNNSIALVALISIAATLRAEEPPVPTPPLTAGQRDGGSSLLKLPARPTGRYAFLSGFIPTSEEQRIRETLPYEWIEIEWTVPGQFYKNIPTVHHRLRLHRDGSASYATGSFGKDVSRAGDIDLSDFGRYALLLEQFGVGQVTCDLGRTVNISHPVESTLRVKPVDSDVLTFRNADKIGDYRFWLIQTALMEQVSEITWKSNASPKTTVP